MIRKKMLSPLFIAAAVVAFPAWSADSDGVAVAPADAAAPIEKPHRVVAEVAQAPARYEAIPAERERWPSSGRRMLNPANPLGATSKVNPLEPSGG